MTIKQISIFIENKFGKLNQTLSYLNEQPLRLIAATVADTTDYGILRIITNDQQKAFQMLKENNVSANMSEVIALRIGNTVQDFAQTIALFTKEGTEIKYTYCFSANGSAILVLRTKNLSNARDVIRKNNLNYIREEELMNL